MSSAQESDERVSFHGLRFPWAYEARINADPSRALGRIKDGRRGWETEDGERFDSLAAAGRYLYDQRKASRVPS